MVMVMNAFDTNFDNENEVYAVNTVAFHYIKHPIQVKVGELVRIYLINMTEFDLINSFHLHASMFRLYRTGTSLDHFELTDTVMMGQGERAVLEFTLDEPGKYMFHAHQSEFAELGWIGFFEAVAVGRRYPMYIEKEAKRTTSRLPAWLTGLIPLLAMGLMLFLFTAVNPLALFNNNLPPIENLSIDRIRVVEDGFEVSVMNSGPHPVRIAQVMVDDAYWQFNVKPAGELPRFGKATVHIPYQWIYAEPHRIQLVTNTGITFEGEVPVATLTPSPGCVNLPAMGCWVFMWA